MILQNIQQNIDKFGNTGKLLTIPINNVDTQFMIILHKISLIICDNIFNILSMQYHKANVPVWKNNVA